VAHSPLRLTHTHSLTLTHSLTHSLSLSVSEGQRTTLPPFISHSLTHSHTVTHSHSLTVTHSLSSLTVTVTHSQSVSHSPPAAAVGTMWGCVGRVTKLRWTEILIFVIGNSECFRWHLSEISRSRWSVENTISRIATLLAKVYGVCCDLESIISKRTIQY